MPGDGGPLDVCTEAAGVSGRQRPESLAQVRHGLVVLGARREVVEPYEGGPERGVVSQHGPSFPSRAPEFRTGTFRATQGGPICTDVPAFEPVKNRVDAQALALLVVLLGFGVLVASLHLAAAAWALKSGVAQPNSTDTTPNAYPASTTSSNPHAATLKTSIHREADPMRGT